MADEQTVTTSEVLFSEVVNAVDPEREIELAKGEIAYEFGGGRIIKREGDGPYATP